MERLPVSVNQVLFNGEYFCLWGNKSPIKSPVLRANSNRTEHVSWTGGRYFVSLEFVLEWMCEQGSRDVKVNGKEWFSSTPFWKTLTLFWNVIFILHVIFLFFRPVSCWIPSSLTPSPVNYKSWLQKHELRAHSGSAKHWKGPVPNDVLMRVWLTRLALKPC